MVQPNNHNSPLAYSKPCLICHKEVPSERNEYRDPNGKMYVWHSPSSRYWTIEGVFCSPECSFIYSQGKNDAT